MSDIDVYRSDEERVAVLVYKHALELWKIIDQVGVEALATNLRAAVESIRLSGKPLSLNDVSAALFSVEDALRQVQEILDEHGET